MKLRSFKSSENIQKKEGGPDSTVSLNELTTNTREREHTIISSFGEAVNLKTEPKGVKIAQICLEFMSLNI